MKRPPHLGSGSKALWDHVVSTYKELETPDLLRLRAACESWDRLQQCRCRLKRDGLFVEDRFGTLKSHPAAALERDTRTGFLRALRELGLDVADVESDAYNRAPRVTPLRSVKK